MNKLLKYGLIIFGIMIVLSFFLAPTETPQKELQIFYSFNGSGSGISEMFFLSEGDVKFNIAGSGNYFIIWLLNSEGDKVKLIVSESGKYHGWKTITIAQSSYYRLSIETMDPWVADIYN